MSAQRVPREEPKAVPASTPHFTSFEHIADPRVRRAKEYEQVLMFAIDRAPAELAARLASELEWARGQQERDNTSDRDRVLKSIRVEKLSRTEIAEDTGLPVATVYKHLQELMTAGLVHTQKLPARGSRGGNNLVVYQQVQARP